MLKLEVKKKKKKKKKKIKNDTKTKQTIRRRWIIEQVKRRHEMEQVIVMS